MKNKIALLSVIFSICLSFSSFAKNKKGIEDKYVKIESNIYISQTEVTNLEYREFLYSLISAGQTEKYKLCLFDSTEWRMPNDDNEPLVVYYHRHPAYNQYPISNITARAMTLYCEWMTEKYNSYAKKKYKKVLFRLPAESEWIRAASVVINGVLPWEGATVVDQKGNLRANLKRTKTNERDGDDGYAPVYSYKPNKIGIYNIIGNAAEYTKQGSIMGGSWDNDISECGIDKKQNYTLPDPRVGFRIVMEVLEP